MLNFQSEIVFYPTPGSSTTTPIPTTTIPTAVPTPTQLSPTPQAAPGGFAQLPTCFGTSGPWVTGKTLDSGVDIDNKLQGKPGPRHPAHAHLRTMAHRNQHQIHRLHFPLYSVLILIFGSESWCITESPFNKLRAFHHRCTCAIAGVSLRYSWRYLITNATTFADVEFHSIRSYVPTKNSDANSDGPATSPACPLPAQSSSYVHVVEPNGQPALTNSLTAKRCSKHSSEFDIDSKRCHAPAQDRRSWRITIGAMGHPSLAGCVGDNGSRHRRCQGPVSTCRIANVFSPRW